MNNIGISVIVPVYKVEKYLERCLRSIMNQSYGNIEIICVYRDYPGEQSVNILKKIQKEDNRIILLEQKSKGLSGARNEGIRIAKGEYLYFADSDDWLEKETLSIVYENMTKDNLDMLCFDANVVCESEEMKDSKHKQFSFLNKENEYEGITTGKALFTKMMEQNEFAMAVWVHAFKTEFILENNLFFIENIYKEDIPYVVESFLRARRIRYINKKLYNYYIYNGSLSNSVTHVDRLYSNVVIYKCLLLWAVQEGKKEVQHLLLQYATNFLEAIRYHDSALTKEEKKDFFMDDPVEDLLLRSMKIGQYNTDDFDVDLYIEGWRNKITTADKIVLYGAGDIGELVYKYLKKYNQEEKVIAFAVSNKVRNEDVKVGRPIWSLEELKEKYCKNPMLVVISVDSKLSNVLYENCINNNINNVIKLDNRIIHYLRTDTKE